MRCYACNNEHAGHHDGDTDRFYCLKCWTAIAAATFVLTDDASNDTLEVEEQGGIHDSYQEYRSHSSDVS